MRASPISGVLTSGIESPPFSACKMQQLSTSHELSIRSDTLCQSVSRSEAGEMASWGILDLTVVGGFSLLAKRKGLENVEQRSTTSDQA